MSIRGINLANLQFRTTLLQPGEGLYVQQHRILPGRLVAGMRIGYEFGSPNRSQGHKPYTRVSQQRNFACGKLSRIFFSLTWADGGGDVVSRFLSLYSKLTGCRSCAHGCDVCINRILVLHVKAQTLHQAGFVCTLQIMVAAIATSMTSPCTTSNVKIDLEPWSTMV